MNLSKEEPNRFYSTAQGHYLVDTKNKRFKRMPIGHGNGHPIDHTWWDYTDFKIVLNGNGFVQLKFTYANPPSFSNSGELSTGTIIDL